MFEDVEEVKFPESEKKEYHFYYNREERIKNAPQIVQDYYAGKMKPLRGISLFTKNKSNLFILIALVFFVGFTWIYNAANKNRNYSKIQDIDFEVTAFCYNDEIFVNTKIKRNPRAKNLSEAEIKADFSAVDADKQVVAKSADVITYKQGEDYLRAKFTDYDIIRVDVLLSVNGEKKELSAIVKR